MSTEQEKPEVPDLSIDQLTNDEATQMWEMSVMRLANSLASNNIIFDDARREAKENFSKNDKVAGFKWTKEQELRMTGVELGVRAALMHEGMVLGIQFAREKIVSLVKQMMEEAKNGPSKLVVPEKKVIIPGG